MQPPTSYQIPKRQVSQDATAHPQRKKRRVSRDIIPAEEPNMMESKPTQTGINPEHDVLVVPAQVTNAQTAEKTTRTPIIHRTRPQVQTRTLNPLVHQWIESLSTARTARIDNARSALSTVAAQHESTLTDLATAHNQAQDSLASHAKEILTYDLPSTKLTFTTRDGVRKGTTTLAERMDLLATRIASARPTVEELLAKRDVLDAEIQGLCDQIRTVLERQEEWEGRVTRQKAEMRATIDGVVDKAVQNWIKSEDQFRRKCARDGISLQRIYQGAADLGQSQPQATNETKIKTKTRMVEDEDEDGDYDDGE